MRNPGLKLIVMGAAALLIQAAVPFSLPATAQQEAAAPTMHWWNDRVFYEIFVRSFKDSDGDGIGDLQGVISMLDYLNDGDPETTTDLGITGIWLMPVAASPSYHGYDVTDYESINPDYGTLEDFDQLIDEAHARGIAVIVDLVVNHTSSQHPWFEASAAGNPAFADWYIWADENPGYRGPENQVVWHNRNGRWYYGLFWSEMPDLNYENPVVTQAMFDIAEAWLTDFRVDGFRLDAIKHIVEEGREQENTAGTYAWLQAFNNYVKAFAPDALLVGEAWTNSFDASNYVTSGAVDLVFEFDLANAMVHSARQGNADGVRSLQNRMLTLYPPGQYAAFLTNHDQNRSFGEVRGNHRRGQIGPALTAASLLLTGPGVPFIYYGEEIGMTGNKPDERIRTPMQWDATPETAGFTTGTPWQPLSEGFIEGVSVDEQTDNPDSLLSHYRNLVHLRNAHPALRTGSFIPVSTGSRRLYAFLREHETETLLILINVWDQAVEDYSLSLTEGSLLPNQTVESIFAHQVEIGALSDALPVNADGGFDSYMPLPEVPPHSTLILRIQ
jgi:glycosidase